MKVIDKTKNIEMIVVKCKKCKKTFFGFTNIDMKTEDQPCPFCEGGYINADL